MRVQFEINKLIFDNIQKQFPIQLKAQKLARNISKKWEINKMDKDN